MELILKNIHFPSGNYPVERTTLGKYMHANFVLNFSLGIEYKA